MLIFELFRPMNEKIVQQGNRVIDQWSINEQQNQQSTGLNQFTINGRLPAEIAALKGPDGMYNVNGVTRSLVADLMQKYPGGPAGGGPYSSLHDINDITNGLKQALAATNEVSPKSRFFYPNRPLPADAIGGYRGDARSGGVENIAKNFDPGDLRFYLGAIKWAQSNRLIDPISPEQWLMILLTEGRDDFGFNSDQWDKQKGPGAVKFEEQLKKLGMTNPIRIGFTAITKAKQDLVKRTGMSFYQAWNGGAANLANFAAQAKAVKDPRNKPILDLITGALA